MMNYKSIGVKIGEKHSFDDFGLIMTRKVIGKPEPKYNLVEVPASSEVIDLTEAVSGGVTYKQRTITMEFSRILEAFDAEAYYSQILEDWNGSKVQIIFDDDVAYYWQGRAVAELTHEGRHLMVTVEAIVDPYKLMLQSTDEDWLWDPFDFETGYIVEGRDIVVDGTRDFYILGNQKQTYPVILSSVDMTVSHGDKTYNLKAGINYMYDLIIEKGENILTFNGHGTITVQYRGGLL